MTAGWRVICLTISFVAFVVALVCSLVPTLGRFVSACLSVGLGAWVLTYLWDANAVYD